MNRFLKTLCCLACAFVFCFLAIGYAAVQDTLTVVGSVALERAVEDICISHEDIDAYALDSVTGELIIKETYVDSGDHKNYRVIGILENGFVGYSEAANIVSVSIPKTVKTIGDNAFTGCSNLKFFTVETGNDDFSTKADVLFDIGGTALLRFPPSNQYPATMLYKVPQETASINRYAFCDLPASTMVVTNHSIASSPWGASSPCLILIAPAHYSAIQSFTGDSANGYTVSTDGTPANTNLVFKDIYSSSGDNREWAAVDSNGQFTIPSNICNPSGPRVLTVATVIGDINKDQLFPDLADDNKALIGGGRWTFGMWEQINKTSNDVELTVNDGYFGGGGVNFSKSNTIINGGVFSVAYFIADTRSDGPSSVVINGGEWTHTGNMNFTSLDSSRISVEIKGGTFHWSGIVASSSRYVITGGTFKFDPTSTGYIPEGYIARDNGDGTWTVIPGTNAVEAAACTCETKCSEPNEACEVCNTDISLCEGAEAPTEEPLTCTCETKCSEPNEACEVCNADFSLCEGADAPTEEPLTCTCETRCSEPNGNCAVCSTDISACTGKDPEPPADDPAQDTEPPAASDPPEEQPSEPVIPDDTQPSDPTVPTEEAMPPPETTQPESSEPEEETE